MDKSELTEAVADCYTDWTTTIEELGREGLEQPGATGDWRVRDVLAHVNCWDRWQLVQLRCAFTGETPTDDQLHGDLEFPPNDDMSEDAMNAMFIAAYRDRTTDDVLAHFREMSKLRADWLAGASQDQLDAVIGSDWTSGSERIVRLASEVPSVSGQERVWERILDQVAHQQSHLRVVREWMASARV